MLGEIVSYLWSLWQTLVGNPGLSRVACYIVFAAIVALFFTAIEGRSIR